MCRGQVLKLVDEQDLARALGARPSDRVANQYLDGQGDLLVEIDRPPSSQLCAKGWEDVGEAGFFGRFWVGLKQLFGMA